MGIFLLGSNVEGFIKAEEVFPDVHLAKATNYCLVVGCRVVITFDQPIADQLDAFYRVTWRSREGDLGRAEVVRRYRDWLKSLTEISNVNPVSVARSDFWPMMASAF